jgi:maltoporin
VSTLWAGNRYYRRQNIDILDYWFWNNSGMGFGIENLDFGAFRLHAAALQHRVQPGTMGLTPEQDPTNARDRVSMWSFDLRATDFRVSTNGVLEVGGMFHRSSVPRAIRNYGGNPNNSGGFTGTVKHTQAGILGGSNALVLMVGQGAGGDTLTFGSYASNGYSDQGPVPNRLDRTSEHRAWRAFDVLTVAPLRGLEAQLVAMQTRHTWKDLDGRAGNETWTSLGMRPSWHLTDLLALTWELGYDRLASDRHDQTPTLLKHTLAFQIMNGRTCDAFPRLRFFITRASWNDAARASADAMLLATSLTDRTSGAYTLSSQGAFGKANRGTTFGVQAELAW